MCENVLSNIYSLVKGIEDLINSIPMVEISLTSGISGILQDVKSSRADVIEGSGYQEVMQKKSTLDYKSSFEAGYNFGESIGLPSLGGAGADTDWKSALEGLNKTGKAVKTTTDDKLFDSDEIQLLLDIATRDYKLNYQQITPNITVTFGDVRETADVDLVMEQVATKLEEIYDGNLEVS